MNRRLRVRGWLAHAVQSHLTRPCRRRVPFSAYRALHTRLRRLYPAGFTDADPFTVVAVDPDRITRSILERSPKYPQWGRVVGGDWDRQHRSFSERRVVRGIFQHFEEGIPWRESALYDAFHEQLDRFGHAWGYTASDGFEQRCREIDRLYERIKAEGYRSQAALRAERRDATPVIDEVNVDIGRNGTLLWRAYGQHRLAIAKLLELPEIPVFLHRRHARWQDRRETVRTGPPPESSGHPDLLDLLDGSSRRADRP